MKYCDIKQGKQQVQDILKTIVCRDVKKVGERRTQQAARGGERQRERNKERRAANDEPQSSRSHDKMSQPPWMTSFHLQLRRNSPRVLQAKPILRLLPLASDLPPRPRFCQEFPLLVLRRLTKDQCIVVKDPSPATGHLAPGALCPLDLALSTGVYGYLLCSTWGYES